VNCVGKFLVVLLMLSIVVNGTQAVVLCTGRDGHVAVEMAGHHHCHNGNESEEAPHGSSEDKNEHKTPCRSCVDIPLSPGIADGPGVQKTPATNAVSSGITPSVSDTADYGFQAYTAGGANPAFTSFYFPLCSIILIV